jgi:hypothetical protein
MSAYLQAITTAGLVLGLAGLTTVEAAQPPPPLEMLTNVAQIRALTPTEAARALPVRLTVVMIGHAAPDGQAVIVADQTAGIYLLATRDSLTNYQRGDLLDIQGVTDPAEFAPIVKAGTVHKR